MEQDLLQGKWDEIKVEIRKVWGDITGEEMSRAVEAEVVQKNDPRSSKRTEMFNPIVIRSGKKIEDANKFWKELQSNPENL